MSSSRVRRIACNAAGRDFVVGDVHGCFRTLERALAELSFDAGCDRLFGVGDLVDRGPHSAEALVWLECRFEAVVMGNHERPLLYWFDPHRRPSPAHRPQWMRCVPCSQHRRWRAALARLVLSVTIETPYGPVGVVHADLPHPDWAVATAMLEEGTPEHVDIALLGIDAPEAEARRHRSRAVHGLRALVHGHFVVDDVERIANRWNVDTGASFPGRDRLTLLHVNASRIHPRTFDVDEAS